MFHPNLTVINATYTSGELELIKSVQSYWTHFAIYGNPGTGSYDKPVNWEPFDISNQGIMNLDVPNCNMTYNVENQTCAFWDIELAFNWLNKF